VKAASRDRHHPDPEEAEHVVVVVIIARQGRPLRVSFNEEAARGDPRGFFGIGGALTAGGR
jgi:hypothetical protein